MIHGQVAYRLVGARVVLRPLVSALAPDTRIGLRALTVDGIPRRAAETIRGQNLSKPYLCAQPLHPLVILAVGQGCVRRRLNRRDGSDRRPKNRNVAQLGLKRYCLTLQSGPDAQLEDPLGRHVGAVREPLERIVVASQCGEVRENAEEEIAVEAERVDLSARLSANKASSVLGVTYDRFHFLANFVFRS